MAIDTSIYGNIKPVQIDSPVNALAQVTALKNAQNQNRLFDMKVAEADRAQQSDQAVRAAYALDDPTARSNALRMADPKAYREDQTFQATQAKTQRETEKEKLSAAKSQIDLIGQVAGAARDPQSYATGRAALQQAGIDVSQIPEQFDPAYVAQARNQALTASQQIDQVWKQKGFDLDVAKFGETIRNNKTQNGIAAGNLGVSRQRLALDQAAPKGQIVQSDNGPILVDPRTGTGKAVTGPDGQQLAGVSKPLNENQSKALLFGSRMRDADKILGTLAKEGTTTSIPGSRTPILGGAISALSSDNRQMLDQAKRDFMTAVLRRESGAAISTGEFDTADKQYFPQPGDGPKVKQQKSRNRQLAIQGILNEVPEKQRGALSASAAPSGDIHAQADAILRGQ